jgi:pimeloyl-ACP methyl ester carboxylesterase
MILKKYILYLILISLGISLTPAQTFPFIPYSELVEGDSVFVSGKKLISHPSGLNLVQFQNLRMDTVFIAVHGYGSRGYEWIHPLRKMADSGWETYFYRWDWTECPQEAAKKLANAILALHEQKPSIRHFILFGHSYGGVIVALMMEMLPDSLSFELHSVAAPLGGHPRLESRCPGFPEFKNDRGEHLTQWRTRKAQDGAYKDLPEDPQVLSLPQSEVIQLPDSVGSMRLGHNRSISWVLDQYLNGRAGAPRK